MVQRSCVLLVAALLALGGAGCAIGTQRAGRVIDAGKIARLKVGVSTKQDVLDLFGPPSNYARVRGAVALAHRDGGGGGDGAIPPEGRAEVDTKPSEDVFTYEYREDQETFFTALVFTRFERDTVRDVLMVFFDTKDVVKYVAYAKETAAQPEGQPAR